MTTLADYWTRIAEQIEDERLRPSFESAFYTGAQAVIAELANESSSLSPEAVTRRAVALIDEIETYQKREKQAGALPEAEITK